MKKKGAIVIAILIMVIGFAAISTTLVINGNTSVRENTEDFDVIFTKASLDGQDVYTNVIDDTKKIINFTTNDLKTLNQKSVLTYEVTNNSNNYDAEVEVNCKVEDNTTAKYTSIENVLEGNATKILAKETLNGTLTVTLDKASTEEIREKYTCEVVATAKERESLGYNGITEWTFDYTGSEQTFTAPTSGIYKIETWGAQGGGQSETLYKGGYGGYSSGYVNLEINKKIYINIGEKGGFCYGNSCIVKESTNGGGSCGSLSYAASGTAESRCSGGGGATHIALISGLLSTLENNINEILIVSGGGGGANYCNEWNYAAGGHAGGYKGVSAIDLGAPAFSINEGLKATGGTQSDGNSFGTGGGLTNSTSFAVGGGGGFYGGKKSGYNGAGGGSGYIGNSLLTEKSMYCYNCTESTEEETKTISTTCANETPTVNCAKSGNGYARITLIR